VKLAILLSSLLINTYPRKGYKVGDVISIVDDKIKLGSKETPEFGFYRLKLVGTDIPTAHALYTGKKLQINPEWMVASETHKTKIDKFIQIGERASKIDLDLTGIPTSAGAFRHAKSHALKAGRKLSRHLETGVTVSVKAAQLVVGNN
jgi:hypothetical protein